MCFLHRKGVCVQEAHCFWQPVTVHAACVNRWEVTNVITFGLSGSSSSQECCVCKPTTGLLHTLVVIYDALQIKWCSTPHTHSKNDPRSCVISLSPSVSSAHVHISSSECSQSPVFTNLLRFGLSSRDLLLNFFSLCFMSSIHKCS